MTYTLDTLNSRNAAAPTEAAGVGRFAQELGLVLGLLALVFWFAALLSYTLNDVAWSTTGAAGNNAATVVARNWGGRLGAWLADGSYFLLGFSVWWTLALGVRAWLVSLARWLRGEPLSVNDVSASDRFKCWACFAFLLLARSAL